jgi:hypothetical protein
VHQCIASCPVRTLPFTYVPNLSAARAFALAASSSRFFGGELASSERRRVAEISAISSTAAKNEASFAFDGLLNPVIFLTNWIEADRISSAVTGGSKLKRGLMFLHMGELGVRRSAFSVRCSAAFGVQRSDVQRSALTKVLLQYQRVISMIATTNPTPDASD